MEREREKERERERERGRLIERYRYRYVSKSKYLIEFFYINTNNVSDSSTFKLLLNV